MGIGDLFGWGRRKPKPMLPPSSNLTEKARSLRALGRHDEAIQLLLGVVESDPSAISLLGNTYKEMGNIAEAKRWFVRGFKLAEKTGIDTSAPARLLAIESLANLGEVEWTQDNRIPSLKYLQKAARLCERNRDDREKMLGQMALATVSLSLAKKCLALERYSDAMSWSRKRMECVPGCTEATAIGVLGRKFLPRGEESKNIHVLLEWRQRLPSSVFVVTVLPHVAQLAERLSNDAALDDIGIAVDENEQQIQFSAQCSDPLRCREMSLSILQMWEQSTDGKGC